MEQAFPNSSWIVKDDRPSPSSLKVIKVHFAAGIELSDHFKTGALSELRPSTGVKGPTEQSGILQNFNHLENRITFWYRRTANLGVITQKSPKKVNNFKQKRADHFHGIQEVRSSILLSSTKVFKGLRQIVVAPFFVRITGRITVW